MLRLANLTRVYRTAVIQTRALNSISLEIQQGEYVAIMGPSGCGKSTMLNILGLLDSPDSGELWFGDREVARLSDSELTALRRDWTGFIYQSFNLVGDLSVVENVEVGLLYRKVERADRRKRALAALERVGLAHRAKHAPSQLSGGQQQRVAIARALVSSPRLILADEPTGNLDSESGKAILDLIKDAHAGGATVVMVTHFPSHTEHAKRIIHLLDGRVVDDLRRDS